jgi:hypothetical protein
MRIGDRVASLLVAALWAALFVLVLPVLLVYVAALGVGGLVAWASSHARAPWRAPGFRPGPMRGSPGTR